MLCLCSFKTEQIVGVPPQLDWNVQSSIPIGIRKSLPAGPPLGRSRGRRRIIAGRVFADRFFYGDLDVLSRTPLPGFVRESSLILRFNSGFDGHFYSTPLPLYSLKVRPIRGIARDETHGADHRSAMHMHELRSFRLQQPIIEHRNALNCFWVILVLASGCCVIRVCVCVGIGTPGAATSKGFYIVFDILQDSGTQQISWIHVPISILFSV